VRHDSELTDPDSPEPTGPEPTGPEPTGALTGLLVADFSRVLAGPYATMLLGDLGATVVKLERPDGGDDTRSWGPPWSAGLSTYFQAVNRNKHSVRCDLTDPADLAAAGQLCRRADVVVENFKAGTMARFGLGPDDVLRTNPGVVYCSITGFGPVAGAQLPGYDALVQALGGLMSITGTPDGEPTKVGVAVVDVLTGLHAVTGILAALRHRDATGQGQLVQVNLLSSLLSGLVNQASGYLNGGGVPGRLGNAHPSIVPYGVFQAADRPILIAVGNDRQFATLCAELGEPGLATDPRFRHNTARVTNRAVLVRALDRALAGAQAADWIARLRARGIPCGPINDISEAFALAVDCGLEPCVAMAAGTGQVSRQVRNPIMLSASPPSYRTAPAPWEHVRPIRDMLRRLGWPD
jgi:crotonobetainyl-CoA:carnitine CoA-transferase CaiB-like acyl-CoA transferase